MNASGNKESVVTPAIAPAAEAPGVIAPIGIKAIVGTNASREKKNNDICFDNVFVAQQRINFYAIWLLAPVFDIPVTGLHGLS